MDWPATPIEHRRRLPGYRFRKHGFFSTQRRKRVPRFLCLTCRATFSRQTFAVSYYCKRPELLQHVAAGLVAGSALRQLARSLECAPNTVARIAARLGRHTMLLHARCLEQLEGKLSEPVGSRSWFVYGLDPAPHGRGGQRSESQARRLRSRPRRATRGRFVGSTDRAQLPEPWPELYRRDWTTPLLDSNARHRLRRAF
jgi:transposase-like protein